MEGGRVGSVRGGRSAGQAGEHLQQETSTGVVNPDLLIGSLEEASSICSQGGRARAAQAGRSSVRGMAAGPCEADISSPARISTFSHLQQLRDEGHTTWHIPSPFHLPTSPGEDEFLTLLSRLAAGYWLPPYQPSKFP